MTNIQVVRRKGQAMKGVYFLANDSVIDLTIAFLNSFRSYNKEIPLCMIPFNNVNSKVVALASKYDFTIFPHKPLLAECDDVSIRFHGSPRGHYRKLAMWQGIFDEFVYIDVDTIVLQNIGFCFDFLCDYSFITSHSNMQWIRRWVWKESIFQTDQLTPEQIEFAANTGFIVSRRNELRLDNITAKLPDALMLADHMELSCAEQPFLNYLIVTSGKRYSSLYIIARELGRLDIPLERWAGMWVGLVRGGTVVPPSSQPPVLLVHWAGEWHLGRHDFHPLWRYYRYLVDADDD